MLMVRFTFSFLLTSHSCEGVEAHLADQLDSGLNVMALDGRSKSYHIFFFIKFFLF